MKIDWTRPARTDWLEASNYLAERSSAAAEKLDARILAAVERLQRWPLSGPIGIVEGTRELVVPRTPYKIIYQVRSDAILILRVLHGARQWPPGK